MTVMRQEGEAPLLAAAAAFALPGASASPPASPLPAPAWVATLAAARRERLEGVLAASIATGAWPATESQVADALDAHRAAMALALVLERELLGTVEALERADIGVRVLKGPAIAHIDEADPSLRCFGDIDLLVPGRLIERAIEVVVGRGGNRRFPEPRPGFDRRFSKGISFGFDRNTEIDLHRTLTLGPFGLTIDTAELFAGAEAFELAGTRLHALDRPSRFLHAAVHAVLGGPRPRVAALRDLVLTAPRDDDELRLALGRARRWQLEAPVGRAVGWARDWLGWEPGPLLRAWASTRPGAARQHRWLKLYEGPDRAPRAQALAGLEAISGFRARLTYAWEVAVPRRSRPTDLVARWRSAPPAIRRALHP